MCSAQQCQLRGARAGSVAQHVAHSGSAQHPEAKAERVKQLLLHHFHHVTDRLKKKLGQKCECGGEKADPTEISFGLE